MKNEKTNEELRKKGLLAECLISKEEIDPAQVKEVVTRLAAMTIEPVQGSSLDRYWMIGYRNRELIEQKYYKIQFFNRGFRISAPGGCNAWGLSRHIIDEMKKGLTIPERKKVA